MLRVTGIVLFAIAAVLAVLPHLVGFDGARRGGEPAEPFDAPRPFAAADSVFLEELTWREVRDALQDESRTVIVATGGIEQNGPYLVTGKHNVILRATTEAIARKLGGTLVAPIIPFVPEGVIEPPTDHMQYPGTISVRESTFEMLLTDVCSSLRAHGFERIVLIGDSGGNQAGLQNVARRLDAQWRGSGGKPTRVAFIPEYYASASLETWLQEQGIAQISEGLHDDFSTTAQMLTVDPRSVRMQERIAAGCFHINGVELAPVETSIDCGRRIVDRRAEATVKAIQQAFAD